jgi:hypothetical protein
MRLFCAYVLSQEGSAKEAAESDEEEGEAAAGIPTKKSLVRSISSKFGLVDKEKEKEKDGEKKEKKEKKEKDPLSRSTKLA